MRRYIGYALIVVALMTLAVWAVSQFVQPVLPPNINGGLVLFFAALLAVLGAFAGFKDTLELFHSIFGRSESPNQPPLPSGPVHIYYGDVYNVTNVTYIARSYSPEIRVDIGEVEVEVEAPSRPPARALAPREAPPIPVDFTGRAIAAQALKKALLEKTHSVGITSLMGMGGIGKSALAALVARDPDVERVFADGTLWASLDSISLPEAMTQWIRVLNPMIDLTAARGDDISLLHLFSQLVQNKRILIVLDDVQKKDADHLRSFVKAVGSQCQVLVTSRLLNLPGVDSRLALDVLPERDALALLEHMISRELTPGEEVIAREIVFLLGYLPLALRLAGGYLNMGASLLELRDTLRAQLEADETLDLDRVRERSTSVRQILVYVYTRLSQEEQKRFRTLPVLLRTRDVFDSKSAVTAWGISLAEVEQTLARFASLGLVQFEGGWYTMHPLIQKFAEDLAGSDEDR